LLSLLAVLVVLGSLAMIGTSVVSGHGRHRDHGALTARLNGENEVPPADEDGRGKARLKVDVDEGEVCFRIRFDNIATPTMGHIHEGAEGVNGPVVIPLLDAATADEDTLDDIERGKLRGCVDADPALLQRIKDTPEEFYINLHNSRYPGGAIRGQLKGNRGHHDDD
jgi:hypothetical protein